MIAIIDYGMGNLRSVQKALEKVGAQTVITQDPAEIKKAQKIVLPGVGAMQPAMDKLKSLNLISVIEESVRQGKPFLGICLGLQLLFEKSSEGGDVAGLGILSGTVERFQSLKVPHMGWNQLQLANSNCPLFSGVENAANVYFCHSYYVRPTDKAITATTTDYGVEFVSSIQKKNIFGVQFHPEKSQSIGLKILENFVKLPEGQTL
ncbi:MAG: imidazole glycerol phosphate synthase, glutamine amidotransferase subunit [Omnitrophica WOR_2 bacterium RIFCSPHIGHO2_01_FULL_48_9]|nr:MAG: imidazole glycerol phosphate synthase, glutamine amidotransferase subunit [Omnitrophica WOR_2 bacterium RIFCSPHIGHO2_02_FULL_48_11]OGX33917.1 MAG: imidazole glycerol phosphate synthase, glutamine amidotransferase subunit [Omnitrophica WOR_2 bacterium RIFCSPHIGHO2_01_FULL_48_9]